MKKTFLAYSISALLSLTAVSHSFAQGSNSSSTAQPSSFEYGSFTEAGQLPTGSLFINEVSTKAQRNFVRDFKNAAGTTWYKLNDGFVAYFTQNETNTRVGYDKKGNYMWTIQDYAEDKLPFDIRHIVKSAYYDLTIHHVDEVKTDRSLVYIIKLEGKATWKTVKVADGEMTVLNDYVKK